MLRMLQTCPWNGGPRFAVLSERSNVYSVAASRAALCERTCLRSSMSICMQIHKFHEDTDSERRNTVRLDRV